MFSDDPLAKLSVTCNVYTSISDFENIPDMLSKHFSDNGLAQIRRELGRLFYFDPMHASGHYSLKMSNRFDRQVAMNLIELNLIETNKRKALRCADTSQNGTFCNFRNCFLGGEACPNFYTANLPSSGELKFDYVSTTRPVNTAAPIPPKRFKSLLQQFRQLWIPEMHTVDHAALGRSVFFSVDQLTAILQLYNSGSATKAGDEMELRIDVAHNLFDRIIDLDQFSKILGEIDDQDEEWRTAPDTGDLPKLMQKNRGRLALAQRLGWLNSWSPIFAEGFYELNLAIHDERIVCDFLIKLAAVEPGDAWQGEKLDGKNWKLPESWVQALPKRGQITVTYFVLAHQQAAQTRSKLHCLTLASGPERQDAGRLLSGVL